MAVTAQGSGTQTASVGTEHTLLDVAVAGTYQLEFSAKNMVAGDILEVRIYLILLTGGTREVVYFGNWLGAQAVDDAIKVSVPVSNELTDAGSLRFTLKQTQGSAGRSYDWKVLKFA